MEKHLSSVKNQLNETFGLNIEQKIVPAKSKNLERPAISAKWKISGNAPSVPDIQQAKPGVFNARPIWRCSNAKPFDLR
jgi:hypothetical protein